MTEIRGIIKNKKYQILALGAGIFSFLLYTICQIVIVNVPKEYKLSLTILFPTLGMSALTIAVIYVLYQKILKHKNEWGFETIYSTNWNNIGIALGGVIVIIIVQLAVVFNTPTGETSTNQASLNSIMNHTSPLFYILIVIVAPISEELIFRGFFFEVFFTTLSKRNILLGSIANGLLFVLAHDTSFSIYFVDYFLTGFVFSLQYLKTKNISTSILTHMFNNTMALLI